MPNLRESSVQGIEDIVEIDENEDEFQTIQDASVSTERRDRKRSVL